MTSLDREWLQGFFGSGNALSLDKIRSAEYPGPFQARLDVMLRRCVGDNLPFLLPRVDDDRRLSFYVVAKSRQELIEVQRVLQAYLGNVDTYLDPRIFVQAHDDVEASLLTRCPFGFTKIVVPVQVSQDKPRSYEVFDKIEEAIEQFGNKPASLAVVRRNIGRILRDFFTACSRQDSQAAVEYLDEAKATHELSGRNLISLELQALAASSKWSALLQHPRTPDLVSGRAPRRIVQIILRAIGNVVVNADEYEESNANQIRESLQAMMPIFQRRPNLDKGDSEQLWKTWCIGAALFGNSVFLEEGISRRVEGRWAKSVAKWAGLESSLQTHRETSLKSELAAPPTFEVAISLLKQALTLDPDDGLEIYTRLATYPVEILEELKAHRTLCSVWDSLSSEYANPIRTRGWGGWLASLLVQPWEALSVQELSESCPYWGSETWNEKEVIEKLYELAESDHASEVRNILPILLEWMVDKNIELTAPFLSTTTLILSSDDALSVQDLGLYSIFLDSLTHAVHTEEDYRDIVSAARHCWGRVQSVNALEPALEVMDALLDGVCADEQSRLQYWNSIQEFCLGSWNRLALEQQLLILRCSEDVTGTVSQFPAIEEPGQEYLDHQPDLAGMRLAIYSLTEGAAKRAREVLERMFPALEIKLNHDKTATAVLVNLAKTADYFVFASRSASHQAFYPVTKKRDEILYPAGKGSSSIIRCFLDAIGAGSES